LVNECSVLDSTRCENSRCRPEQPVQTKVHSGMTTYCDMLPVEIINVAVPVDLH